MSFGVEFRNKDSALIIDGTAKCMHYWGKISISVYSGSINTPIPLFNIPVTKNIRVYSVPREGHNPVLVRLFTTSPSGNYHVTIMPSIDMDIVGTIVDVYVFVDASAFTNIGQWGLQINTPNGLDTAFISSRPLLSAGIIAQTILFSYQTAENTFNLMSMGRRRAVMMYISNSWTYRDRDFTWKTWSGSPCIWWHVPTSGNGFWRLDGCVWRTSNPVIQETSRTRITSSLRPEVIDADYYDQFTSLGNYVP